MVNLDLTQEPWCLHHLNSVSEVEAVIKNLAVTEGANTDVTLTFSVLDFTIASNPPVDDDLINAMAMRGTWYLGTIITDDPHSADKDKNRGQYWAKVFPATPDNPNGPHGILIIQQNIPVDGGPSAVRIFTGHYLENQNLFFGHGADNLANSLFSFTLKAGACRPSVVPIHT